MCVCVGTNISLSRTSKPRLNLVNKVYDFYVSPRPNVIICLISGVGSESAVNNARSGKNQTNKFISNRIRINIGTMTVCNHGFLPSPSCYFMSQTIYKCEHRVVQFYLYSCLNMWTKQTKLVPNCKSIFGKRVHSEVWKSTDIRKDLKKKSENLLCYQFWPQKGHSIKTQEQ